MLKLYNYFRSSASFRVRIALNIKGLNYDDIAVHLLKDGGEQHGNAYQTLNPQGLVPLLYDNGKTISQSLAIIEYLEDTHPTPALLPKDSYLKAKIRAFALAIACDLHPLNNLRVLQYLTNDLHLTEEQKSTWYQHWVNKTFTALEKEISAFNYPFCYTETPSLADVVLIPQIYNAKRFAVDLTPYPTLVKIDTHCQQLPAFKKAWPNEVTQ